MAELDVLPATAAPSPGAFEEAFRKGDRDGLERSARGLFETLRGDHRITHLYFTGPDRINLYRLHTPAEHGDRIDRAWYLQYERALNSGYNAPADANALSANYVWTRRAFDSLVFPTRGHALSAELGGGMTLDGGREPFGRVQARWMGFVPLGDRAQRSPAGSVNRTSRIAARAEVGAVIARPEAILPTTQLFLTGGDNTVRGYAYRSIGVTLPDGQTTAGRYLAAGSLEWQRPISVNGRQSDWDSTVFVDAGGVANQPEDMRAKVGVGAGARWNSPVGPLQIDLAWGVATQKLRLHLSMGLTF